MSQILLLLKPLELIVTQPAPWLRCETSLSRIFLCPQSRISWGACLDYSGMEYQFQCGQCEVFRKCLLSIKFVVNMPVSSLFWFKGSARFPQGWGLIYLMVCLKNLTCFTMTIWGKSKSFWNMSYPSNWSESSAWRDEQAWTARSAASYLDVKASQ